VPVVIGVVVAIVIVLNLLRYWRRPSERTFRCGKCSTPTMHTRRTIEAWRIGKRKFFCDSCHTQWLQSLPTQQVTSRRAESSGCLGVIVVTVGTTLVTYLVVKLLA
jgi:hypothetical protein